MGRREYSPGNSFFRVKTRGNGRKTFICMVTFNKAKNEGTNYSNVYLSCFTPVF